MICALAACGNRNQDTMEDTSAESETPVPVTEPSDNSTGSGEGNNVNGAEGTDTAGAVFPERFRRFRNCSRMRRSFLTDFLSPGTAYQEQKTLL